MGAGCRSDKDLEIGPVQILLDDTLAPPDALDMRSMMSFQDASKMTKKVSLIQVQS